MRGTRVKALRREFFRLHGRAVEGAEKLSVEAHGGAGSKKPWLDQIKVAPSRWITFWTERLPGAAARQNAVSSHAVGEMFMRQIFGMKVVRPSEWREWKRGYRERGAAFSESPE